MRGKLESLSLPCVDYDQYGGMRAELEHHARSWRPLRALVTHHKA